MALSEKIGKGDLLGSSFFFLRCCAFWVLCCTIAFEGLAKASDPYESPAIAANPAAASTPEKHTTKAIATRPFDTDDYHRLVVPVTMASYGQGLFMIDSASARTVLFRSGALLINAVPQPSDSIKVITATGMVTAPVYKMGKIRFGPFEITVPTTPAISLTVQPDLIGLLGLDMLIGRAWHVNYEDNEISAFPHAADFAGADAQWDSVPSAQVPGHGIFVTVDVQGVSVTALVDTGAALSILNPAAANALGDALSSARKTGKAVQHVEASAGALPSTSYSLGPVKLGRTVFANHDFTIADLPIFRILNMDEKPAIILGMDILKQQSFVLDFDSRRLFLRN